LWYDTNLNKLRVYNGEEFVSAAGSFVSQSVPQQPIPGDTWFDTSRNQLFLYDGGEFRLVGPQFTLQQGLSGVQVRTVQDTNSNSRTVLVIRVGEMLQAIVAREQFTPKPEIGNIVQELVSTSNPTGIIYPGYNLVNTNTFKYRGTSTRSENLITQTNIEFPAEEVLRKDIDQTMQGTLLINNAVGLTIGSNNRSTFTMSNGLVIENLANNEDVRVVVNSSTVATDAVTILTEPQLVGIFNAAPEHTLDVAGDVRITGNLTVEGSRVDIEVQRLRVEDINIQLGASGDSTPISDAMANGGGITLFGDQEKTFDWRLSTNSWTSSENMDLAEGKSYKISGVTLLNKNSLSDDILTATGLTRVGVLDYVDINTVRIGATAADPNTPAAVITRTGSGNVGLTIAVGGNIDVDNNRITKLANPFAATDASNKYYVDIEVNKAPIIFSLDITGWGDPTTINTNIVAHLTQVFPPDLGFTGKQARIITSYITSQVIDGIDVRTPSDITYVRAMVDARDPNAPGYTPADEFSDLSTREVVEDISLPTNLSVPYTPIIERITRLYEINSIGAWAVKNVPGTQDNTYPVIPD